MGKFNSQRIWSGASALSCVAYLLIGTVCAHADPVYSICMEQFARRANQASLDVDDEKREDGVSRRIMVFSPGGSEILEPIHAQADECLTGSFEKKASIRGGEYWGYISKLQDSLQWCEMPKSVGPWDGVERRGQPMTAVICEYRDRP